jgi:hypothetical protein
VTVKNNDAQRLLCVAANIGSQGKRVLPNKKSMIFVLPRLELAHAHP